MPIPYVIDIRSAPDGTPVAEATLDLSTEQLAAAAHMLREARADRYRTSRLESADEVLAMRELTALADELGELAHHGAHVRVAATVARLGVMRDALEEFSASRAEGMLREGDAEAVRHVDALLDAVCAAHGEAVRAALEGGAPAPAW